MNNNKYISIKYFYEKNNNKILKIIFKRFSSVNNIFPAYPFKLFFNIVYYTEITICLFILDPREIFFVALKITSSSLVYCAYNVPFVLHTVHTYIFHLP